MRVPSLAGRVETGLASRESLRNPHPRLRGQGREWGKGNMYSKLIVLRKHQQLYLDIFYFELLSIQALWWFKANPKTHEGRYSLSLSTSSLVAGIWPRVCQSDALSPSGLWNLSGTALQGRKAIIPGDLSSQTCRRAAVKSLEGTMQSQHPGQAHPWHDPDCACLPCFLPFSWGWFFNIVTVTVRSPIASQQTPFLLQLVRIRFCGLQPRTWLIRLLGFNYGIYIGRWHEVLTFFPK